MSQLNSLKGMEVTLESFLTRYVASKSQQLEKLEAIERLDSIAAEVNMGDLNPERVNRWISEHSSLAESSSLSPAERERISRLLLDVQSKITNRLSKEDLQSGMENLLTFSESSSPPAEAKPGDSTPGKKAARPEVKSADSEIDSGKKISAGRKITLRKQAEESATDLYQNFLETLWKELELTDNEYARGRHALTRLDEMITDAEIKDDSLYLHLAGSFLYFLKLEGYKMAPYAERLRKIEPRRKQNEEPRSAS